MLPRVISDMELFITSCEQCLKHGTYLATDNNFHAFCSLDCVVKWEEATNISFKRDGLHG